MRAECLHYEPPSGRERLGRRKREVSETKCVCNIDRFVSLVYRLVEAWCILHPSRQFILSFISAL